MSLVKVFVPCYQYARYLPAAVDSVLAQPDVDVRVLILDDCSPDETPEIARGLMARDSRVEYHRNLVNIGHIATYNIGLEWASDGDYTVLLSADDMLTPGALRRAVALLDTHPAVGFAYGGSVTFHDHEALPPGRTGTATGTWRITTGQHWIRRACDLAHIYIRSPEVVVRTALQRRLGGYRATLPHTGDIEMWMRFAAHADVGEIVDADQAYYRVHGRNMHVQRFGMYLDDLRQRKLAYDTIFEDYGDRIDSVKQLRSAVNRRLAREALGAAGAALDQGQTAGMLPADLRAFALATDRGAFVSLESLGVHARIFLGGWAPPLIAGARSVLRSARHVPRPS